MKFLQKGPFCPRVSCPMTPQCWLRNAFPSLLFFSLAIRLSWPLGVFVFDILILYLHSGDGQQVPRAAVPLVAIGDFLERSTWDHSVEAAGRADTSGLTRALGVHSALCIHLALCSGLNTDNWVTRQFKGNPHLFLSSVFAQTLCTCWMPAFSSVFILAVFSMRLFWSLRDLTWNEHPCLGDWIVPPLSELIHWSPSSWELMLSEKAMCLLQSPDWPADDSFAGVQ